MNIQECYAAMGGNYQEVLNRLRSEAFIIKFARKFPEDGSFAELQQGLAEGDAEKAFRAAHTLKGVCVNLGFDALYEVSSALTEKLRGRVLDGYEPYYEKVAEAYQKTVDAIAQLD